MSSINPPAPQSFKFCSSNWATPIQVVFVFFGRDRDLKEIGPRIKQQLLLGRMGRCVAAR